MGQDSIRQKLIDGTIHIIACDGMDKASAKRIENETGINVAYIYRCFDDKEDMLAETFKYLDVSLRDFILERLPIMYMTDFSVEERCRLMFDALWNFLLEDKDEFLCYVRYFYSPYFKKNSSKEHYKTFESVLEKLSPAFKEEADVWMILNHILNVMLDFAVKVFNDEMPENDNYSEHVFRVIYVSVKQYFKGN